MEQAPENVIQAVRDLVEALTKEGVPALIIVVNLAEQKVEVFANGR